MDITILQALARAGIPPRHEDETYQGDEPCGGCGHPIEEHSDFSGECWRRACTCVCFTDPETGEQPMRDGL